MRARLEARIVGRMLTRLSIARRLEAVLRHVVRRHERKGNA